jgi:hypothetical protein
LRHVAPSVADRSNRRGIKPLPQNLKAPSPWLRQRVAELPANGRE